jgi:predicted nucleic acid-binding protein
MEILAGARNEQHLQRLRRLLARATVLPTGPAHYDHAASIYRHCRREGETVRKLIDCLIAAVALSADVMLLHRDTDFEAIGRRTELKVDEASGLDE